MGWAGAVGPSGGRLRVPDAEHYSPHGSYFLDLLRLAWRKSAPGPEPELEFAQTPPGLPRERLRSLLAEGELDLLWSTSTPEREVKYLPVRINLLHGLNEHRVLLVRRRDLANYRTLASLNALRELRAGLGQHWSDVQVFRSQGFAVTPAVQYDALFRMLAAGRFDFIPRTLFEVEEDLRRFGELELAVLPGLVLSYPQPYYFFVTPRCPELAQRLLRGLLSAQQDGSVYARFMAEATLREAWERLARMEAVRLRLG